MKSIFKFFTLITALICTTVGFTQLSFAASFSLNSSTKQVTPGGTFSISVGGDCIGRVNLKVSNGSLSQAAVWVEENYQSVTVTAGTSGTVTVTATPETGFSDSDANEYKPGSRSVSVSIVAPAQPSKPSTSGNTSTNKPSTPNKPQTNQPTQKPSAETLNTPSDNPDSSDQDKDQDNSNQDNNPEDSSDNQASEESSKDQATPDPCAALSQNNKLAWGTAITFIILFLLTAGTLAFVLYKTKSKK